MYTNIMYSGLYYAVNINPNSTHGSVNKKDK